MRTTFNIYFDGGTIGANNGSKCDGYGSWQIVWNGFIKTMSRKIFLQETHHIPITNNVAEYLSLLDALDWLSTVLNKNDYSIKISGDSQLVLKQIEGSMKTRGGNLLKLRDSAREYISSFASQEIDWQPRKHSVKRFGH